MAARLIPGSCSQPVSCRHRIELDVLGVSVVVLMCVCGVRNDGFTCLQETVRSPLVAAMELDGIGRFGCVCVLLLFCACRVTDGGLNCFQVAAHSP